MSPLATPSRALAMGALLSAACLLGACTPSPSSPSDTPQPPKPLVQTESLPVAAAGADTSVPPASSVLTPPAGTQPEAASAGRSNSGLSAAQESSAMPLPGQNNDHSAPLIPAKRASAP